MNGICNFPVDHNAFNFLYIIKLTTIIYSLNLTIITQTFTSFDNKVFISLCSNCFLITKLLSHHCHSLQQLQANILMVIYSVVAEQG